MLARDGGFIQAGYHAELDRLKVLKDERRQLIAELQKRYADESGWLRVYPRRSHDWLEHLGNVDLSQQGDE